MVVQGVSEGCKNEWKKILLEINKFPLWNEWSEDKVCFSSQYGKKDWEGYIWMSIYSVFGIFEFLI